VAPERINRLHAQPAAWLVEEADTNLMQGSTTALPAWLVSTKLQMASLSVTLALPVNTKRWQLKNHAISAKQGRTAVHSPWHVMTVLQDRTPMHWPQWAAPHANHVQKVTTLHRRKWRVRLARQESTAGHSRPHARRVK
jgi:hypothetical protein